MRKQTAKGEIVKNYLVKFPNSPTLTLAKKIYSENPKSFMDVEDVRSTIRYHRGQHGDTSRKQVKDKSHFRKGDFNPFKLPESYAEKREPFRLPKSCTNVLVISDLHVPYQDNMAITAALNYGLENKINCVVILGDLLDFFMCSRFEKVPYKRSIAQEFDAARSILSVLRNTFPEAPIYYVMGNHCERYEKWLFVKAPEIFDVPEFQLDELLRLNEFKVKLIRGDVLVKAGKLNLTHGHHVIKGVFAPVNPARGAFMKAKSSILIGHCHQTSEHTEATLNGDTITTWSIGCLSQLHPDYDPLNTKHNTGFAHIIIGDNGNYKVKNMRIIHGQIV